MTSEAMSKLVAGALRNRASLPLEGREGGNGESGELVLTLLNPGEPACALLPSCEEGGATIAQAGPLD